MKKALFAKQVAAILAMVAVTSLEAKTKTSNGGYKIHGGGFRCASYENTTIQTKNEWLTYGKLAGAAYQDDGIAYGKADSAEKQVDTAHAYEGTGYVPLTESETKELLNDTGLRVVSSRSSNAASSIMVVGEKSETRLNAIILKESPGKYDSQGRYVGEYVISYRGSKELGDWVDDGKQVADKLGVTPQQYKDAATLFRTVLDSTSSTGNKITCTGHSLGGGLLTYAMGSVNYSGRDVKGYAYNGAGLSEKTMNTCQNAGQAAKDIVNIRNEKDPVSYVGYHLGPTYEITTAASDLNRHIVKNDHGLTGLLDNMIVAQKIQDGTGATIAEMQEQWRISNDEKKNEDAKLESFDARATETQNRQAAPEQDSGRDSSTQTKQQQLAGEMVNEGSNGQEKVNNPLVESYAKLPSETADASEVQRKANEQFDKTIEDAIEDKSLVEKIKEAVTKKIDEAIEKAEDWVEKGGIRDLIKKELNKLLKGKVSEDDKQRIINMADALCDVKDDGGEKFVKVLKTDGKDLAISLAVNEIKKQIASVLPEDEATLVNSMLDSLADGGNSQEIKQKILQNIKDYIKEKIPYENSVNALNGILDKVVNGQSVQVMDEIKNLGKAIGLDALKDAISKNLDPAVAAELNKLIDGYASGGLTGLTDAAMKEIESLVDQYAPGADSAQKIKAVLNGIRNGNVTIDDIKNAGNSILADGAKRLIDNSNLPQPIKDIANTAIDGLQEGGLTGLATNIEDYIHDYVEDALGSEAADAVTDVIDAVFTPGADPWEELISQAPVIGASIGKKVLATVEKYAAQQFDRLIAKYPVLGEICAALGINGESIVGAIKNVMGVIFNADSIKDAISQLSQMAVTFLKDMAAKLIDWALGKVKEWINNQLIPKAIDWATQKLGQWADSAHNSLVKKGLQWLQKQVQNCKKCARISIKTEGVGAKVINKLDTMIKGGGKSNTVIKGTTGGGK